MPTAFQYNSGSIKINVLITFANFNTSQCKQTHVCVNKVVKRPEDPFPRVCRVLPMVKVNRNVVNGNLLGINRLELLSRYHDVTDDRSRSLKSNTAGAPLYESESSTKYKCKHRFMKNKPPVIVSK